VRPTELIERFDELFGRPAERRKSDALLPRGRVRAVAADVKAWRRSLNQDLAALGRSLAPEASEFGEAQLPRNAATRHPEASQLAKTIARRLEEIAGTAEDLAAVDDLAEEGEDLAVTRAAEDLRAAADGLRRAFREPLDDAVAAFERLDPPYDRWRLVIRAVSPAEAFHTGFVDRLEALACVSASLFIAGDSTASLGELELDLPGDERVTRLEVASPFDYARQMRVVAFASRGSLVDEMTETLAQTTRLLGGRCLGLFTSLRRMRDVDERLAEALRGEGFDILAPRRATDDPAALVERFRRAGGGGVLLGARTFWQGIDIAGPALQAVVIEKLPFEVPTELRRRREDRIKAEIGDAFGRYTLGKMLLNLKQMVGRLIRAEDDRGIVVIVEGRTDKGYFRRLGDALPAGSRVTEAKLSDLPALLSEVGIRTDG